MDRAEKEATLALKAAVIEMVHRRTETAERTSITNFVIKGTDRANRTPQWGLSRPR